MTITNRKTSKGKKAAAMLAALMAASTMASISASALPSSLWGDQMPDPNPVIRTVCEEEDKTTDPAEEFVKKKLDGLSYREVLSVWEKVMKNPGTAFKEGNDIDGDGVVTTEETDAVSKKIREYGAAMTAGLLKMGLQHYCAEMQFVFDKPISDLTNAMFGVKSTSNNDIIKTINSSTQQIINRISEAEETIVKRSTNISVANEYGAAVDKFYSAADLYRSFLETASDDGTIEENAVAIAAKLGDMNRWESNDLVVKMGLANYYFTSDYCTTDSENGNNIYEIAMQKAIDKGSKFMKEAVENSERYIIQTTNKYTKACLTMLEMLSSMQTVSKLTPEQVAALPATLKDDYKAIAAHADQAYSYEADILNDLVGEDGILTKTDKYLERKETQPTTFVARGLNDFVELENYLDYRNNLTFCEAYPKRTIRAGYDWRWVKGYEDYMIKRGGLSYSEIEGICKHAFSLGYNVENYLKANGFDVDKNAESGKTRVMPTGFYDDDEGPAFSGYNSDLGFKGYKTTTGYNKYAGAEKFKSICKVHEPFWVPLVWEIRNEDNNDIYAFFVQKGKADWIEGTPEPA